MRFLAVALAVLVQVAPVQAATSTAFAPAAYATQKVPGSRFAALATAALRTLPANADAVPVANGPVADQIVGVGTVSLVAHAPIATPYFVNVPIALDLNGVQQRVVYVGYRIQRYQRTAVAAHDIVPGTVLADSDVAMERVPFYGRKANGSDALIGRRVTSAVRQGEPIYLEQTQTNQIVKSGASVILVVRDAGVALVADAIARSGGGLGDQVSVYNPSTKKTLSGTVVGPNRVELDIDVPEESQ